MLVAKRDIRIHENLKALNEILELLLFRRRFFGRKGQRKLDTRIGVFAYCSTTEVEFSPGPSLRCSLLRHVRCS
jgi:hypothetical protein